MAFVRKRGGSHQLIETYRQDGRVKQRIIANLGHKDTVEGAIEFWVKVLPIIDRQIEFLENGWKFLPAFKFFESAMALGLGFLSFGVSLEGLNRPQPDTPVHNQMTKTIAIRKKQRAAGKATLEALKAWGADVPEIVGEPVDVEETAQRKPMSDDELHQMGRGIFVSAPGPRL
jgi:hypothetical protein